jgi:hypothetical protein
MTNAQLAAFLGALALLLASGGNADAQGAGISSTSVKQQVLSLDFTSNGQSLSIPVGQRIEITLGSFGLNPYGAPQISSPAIRLESVAQVERPNPFNGAPNIYMFEAVGEGEVQVKFSLITKDPDLAKRLAFGITIHVGPGGEPPAHALMTPDQANIVPWANASMNVHSLLRQTFTPSLPRLTGVEVELVVANPGPSDDELTMYLGNAEGEVLAVVSKTVPVADCRHVLVVFPNGGLQVFPGQVYSIRLSGSSVFGWNMSWAAMRTGLRFSMADLFYRIPVARFYSGPSARIEQPARCT